MNSVSHKPVYPVRGILEVAGLQWLVPPAPSPCKKKKWKLVSQAFVSMLCPYKKPGAKASHCGLTLKDFKWKNTKKVRYLGHSSANLVSVICHLCLTSSLMNYTGGKATGKQMFKAQRCQRDQARGWVGLQRRP